MRKTIIGWILDVGCRRFAVANWIFVLAFILHNSSFILSSDWPQLQCNPQRTGYTPDRPDPPYVVKWQWSPLPGDTLSSIAQPVATRKAVFQPTLGGMLYAFAASDGKELWKARVGRGCFHSAACENERVFAASLDGYVTAVDADTGAEQWRTRGPGIAGFVTAPLLADGRIFLGDMDGNMTAFEQVDGNIAWSSDLGVPIVQAAAYNDPGAGGRVYVGGQDMRMRALDARTGETIWTSEQLSGMSMEPYHPLVFNGFVIVRPMLLSDEIWSFIEVEYNAPPEKWDEYLANRPERQDMFLLDENTGREAFKVPHQQERRRGRVPSPPPCVDAEGKLIIPIRADTGAGWKMATWGRLDLATRTIEPIGVAKHNQSLLAAIGESSDISFHGGAGQGRGNPYQEDGRLGAGGNLDETNLFSAGGRIIFFAHDIEGAQSEFQGYYDLDKKRWWYMGIGSLQGRIWERMIWRPDSDWQPHPGADAVYTGPRGFRGWGDYSHHAFAITDSRLYHHTFEVLAAWGSAGEKGE